MLRNLFGTHDPDELNDLEYAATALRLDELRAGEVDIARTGDAAEWREIHRHIFQDVFEWAGQYRNVEIDKSGERFLNSTAMDSYLHYALRETREIDWSGLDRTQFVDAAAATYMKLNFAHPFREGNGRSSRAFLDRLTGEARFECDYSRVEAAVWNEASRATMHLDYKMPTGHSPLVPVFDAITVDRAEQATVERDDDPQLAADIARVQAALRAQSPRSARSGSAPEVPSIEVTPPMPQRDTGYEL
ncbi:Fic/DOC family protein [Nocardia sp. NPDC058176]|uniref:Fic/DOC family protein n=1 Tax=Nocardia sp. NPDC058176 TaxID=3346368 RepID=UPI0036DE013B